MIDGQLKQFPKIKEIFQEQMNKFEIDIELGKNFSQLKDLREQGMTIPMAIFNLFKANLQLSLNPDLPDKLREATGETMQQQGMPVGMIV